MENFSTNIALLKGKVDPQIQEEMAGAQAVGEPIITGFDSTMLASEFSHIGLQLHENLNQAEVQKRYLQGRKCAYIAQAVVE